MNTRPLFGTAARAALCMVALGACNAAGRVADPGPAVDACQARTRVDLQPGERRSLAAADAACFSVPGRSGARYVLAGFDARALESARTGPEASLATEPVYHLGHGSPGAALQAAPSRTVAGGAAPAADLELRLSLDADAAEPFRRAARWQVGERFSVRHVERGRPTTARVERIVGGRFVVAVVEEDAGSHAARLVSDAAKALEWLDREGVPVLAGVFGGAVPVTSPGSGQLLVLLAAWNPDGGAGAATTYAAPDGSGTGSYLWLNLEVRSGVREGFDRLDNATYRLKVLAHELAHAWQAAYAYREQPAGERRMTFGPAWALEGSADLLAMDLVRRSLGVGLTANWDWQARLHAGGKDVVYALEPYDTRGRLARGYFDAASFLRDLQVRLTRAGLAADAALAEVARGAVEGWFGIDGAGVRRTGLTARARAVLGSSWDPAEAVLLWTLTQAADDQTSSPELNNVAYARVGDAGSPYAWKAAGEVEAGRAFSHEVRVGAGSSFFLRVKDDGRGGTLSATSNVADARWMIARIR